MLVVSEANEDYYHLQHGKFEYELRKDGFYRSFSPLPGVTVEVTLKVDFPSHTRAYRITTDRAIDVADGGFSIAAEQNGRLYTPDMVELTAQSVTARFPWGESGIACHDHPCQPALIKVFPNTNLLHPLTRIPTIKLRLEAGTHCFTTRVTGRI